MDGGNKTDGSDMSSGNKTASDVEMSQADESVRACGNGTTEALAPTASSGNTNEKPTALGHFTLETVSEECTELRCNRCWKTFAYISGSKVRSASHLKRHLYSCHGKKSLGRPSIGGRDRDSRSSSFQIEVPDGHKKDEETKVKIQYTRPISFPLKCPGYAIIDMKGSPHSVWQRWRRAILTFRLWCFNTSDQRYQFGHPHKLSCVLPKSGHFLFYFCNGSTNWLCAVIDGPSAYLDGYITRSTGKHYELRVRENQAKKQKGQKGPREPCLIEKAKELPWPGTYSVGASCRLGYHGLFWSVKTMHQFVETGLDNGFVEHAGQTIIVHTSEAGRSDSLMEDIDDCFCSDGVHLLGPERLEKAQNWSNDS